jgi:hypothetical protein
MAADKKEVVMNRQVSIIALVGVLFASSPALAGRVANRTVKAAVSAKKRVGASWRATSHAGWKLGKLRPQKRIAAGKARSLVKSALRSSDQVTDKTEPFRITIGRPDAAGARRFTASNERRIITVGSAPEGAQGGAFIHGGNTVTGTILADGTVTFDQVSRPRDL